MCGAKLPLFSLLLVLSASLSGQSFDDKLQAAVAPLLTWPEKQRLAVIGVLTIYDAELWSLRDEVRTLNTDLTRTREQVDEQSKLSEKERAAHRLELEAVESREAWTAAGGFTVGALAVALLWAFH